MRLANRERRDNPRSGHGDRQQGTREARADRARRRQALHPARREGPIKESDDVGKSLAADVRRSAKTTVSAGQGDKGDQKKGK
jgi:hypothetical protein